MSGVIRAEMKKGITLEMWIEIVNCGGKKKMGVFQIKYIAEVLEMKWASSCKIERYRWTQFTHEQKFKVVVFKILEQVFDHEVLTSTLISILWLDVV